MKKLLLLIITLATLLATSTPAFGLQVRDPNPSDAFITEDGILVRGDTQIDCRSFARLVKQYKETGTTDPYPPSELQQATNALQECKANGFSASDEVLLPNTGGADLLLLGTGTLLVTSGLLRLRIDR
jgi:hypothetical protein